MTARKRLLEEQFTFMVVNPVDPGTFADALSVCHAIFPTQQMSAERAAICVVQSERTNQSWKCTLALDVLQFAFHDNACNGVIV